MRIRGKKGFTMVELIVVLIIVGVIAASGFILLRSNQDKFIAQEAIQTMGSLSRSIMQQKKTTSFVVQFSGAPGLVYEVVPGMDAGSIGSGKYYNANSFSIADIAQTPGSSGTLTFTLRGQRMLGLAKWHRVEQVFSTDPDVAADAPTMSYAETAY